MKTEAAEIHIEYAQNFHDWRDSLIAARVLNPRPHLQFVALSAGCGVLAMIALFADRVGLVLIHVGLMLAFAGLAFVAKNVADHRLRRKWNESRNTNLLLRICFREDGVTIDTDRMHTELKWLAFIRYVETPRLIVCLIGTGNILALPKASIPLETQNALRGLLQRKLTANQPAFGFPVVQTDEKR